MRIRVALVLASTALAACSDDNITATPDSPPASIDAKVADAPAAAAHKVIVFVWDGLRPDSIDATDTPNLFALRQSGVEFADNHSTYPTFTMMNAASFATGARPAQTGFYGNTFYAPGPTGKNAAGANVDFSQPVFSEDYAILADVDAFYTGGLVLIGTLFQAAQTAGLKTAAVGKSGPAYLQDYKKGGFIIDENFAYPASLRDAIVAGGKPLPRNTPVFYGTGIPDAPANPTGAGAVARLVDGVTSNPDDPTTGTTSPHDSANGYMLNVYLDQILGPQQPSLTLIWFRTPDSTEHAYGPGTAAYRDGLKSQDALLGMLQAKLQALGIADSVDIIVVSDHGHSSVSGPLDLFPLRGLAGGDVDLAATNSTGYSVSGNVRMADLLTKAGVANVFDGNGCINDPVLSGIKSDGQRLYPQSTDADGSKCGTAGAKYVTPRYLVPAGTLPARSVVVATNGGSDYIYVPDHDAATVAQVVEILQAREEVGAIFVATHHGYSLPPGTLALDTIEVEGTHGRSPDIVFSYSYDEAAVVAGMTGIEFESSANNRGMHGSFSPIDVHNTLYAVGPDFRAGFKDPLPTANVDVAPTVAKILGLALPGAVGRSLDEALVGGSTDGYDSQPHKVAPPATKSGLDMVNAVNQPDGTKSSYSIELGTKVLTKGSASWTYFDYAKAVRQ